MSEEPPSPLRRILVGLNASPHSQAALDAATRLAEIFEAELSGVFVEDETLLRTAQLPFAEEIRAYTVPPKRLDDQRLHRQLRYQAEYAEHSLQQAAERVEVGHSFQVLQGNVTQELLRVSTEADLLVLGKTSTESSRRRLGTTSHTLLSDAASPVMVVRKTMPAQQPILTYYDGSDPSVAALHLATQLSARAPDSPVNVLLPASDEAETERLHQEIQARYGNTDLRLYVHSLTRTEMQRLGALASRQSGGLVILPADCPALANASFKQFLYELDRPLLVMR